MISQLILNRHKKLFTFYNFLHIHSTIEVNALNKTEVVIGKKNLRFFVPKYMSPGSLNKDSLDIYGNISPIIVKTIPRVNMNFCIYF